MLSIRLIVNRLQELPRLRPAKKKSSYVGTEISYEIDGTLTAEVQPISDSSAAQLYGVEISRAVLLLCEPTEHISERERVMIRGEQYEVKGVTHYGNIIKAAAERVTA